MKFTINELRELVKEQLATVGDAQVADAPAEAAVEALQKQYTTLKTDLETFKADIEGLQRRLETSKKDEEKEQAGEATEDVFAALGVE